MADLFHEPAVVGGLSALGTAALAWLGQRLVGKAALETALRETAKEMLAQLRQELKVALRERDKARDDVAERDAQIEELKAVIAALELRVAATGLVAHLPATT